MAEDPHDYDLRMLDERYAMLRPREHSAQIPEADQGFVERSLKGEGQTINAVVCTPTLELGVDIGALDVYLMRNVPPHRPSTGSAPGGPGAASGWRSR